MGGWGDGTSNTKDELAASDLPVSSSVSGWWRMPPSELGLALRNNSSTDLHRLYGQPWSLSVNSLLDIANVPSVICPQLPTAPFAAEAIKAVNT